jgi:lipoyl-dependent peroxiredoxin
MALRSTATAHWEGDLSSGTGTTSLESGTAVGLPITWKARTEEHGSNTSPEELIAAAHASCFSMALSNGLAQQGHPPANLVTSATATFDRTDAGFRLTTMEITVRGDVPGLDEHSFREAAETARENCPVSQALKGNVEISVDAALA